MDEMDFTTKNGHQVKLEFDGSIVSVTDSSGNEVGRVGFQFREGDPEHAIPDELILYEADVDEAYQRQGIARECVVFARDMTGVDAVTAPHSTDSMRHDGNYLTGDGAALVRSLRQEGIVSPHGKDASD